MDGRATLSLSLKLQLNSIFLKCRVMVFSTWHKPVGPDFFFQRVWVGLGVTYSNELFYKRQWNKFSLSFSRTSAGIVCCYWELFHIIREHRKINTFLHFYYKIQWILNMKTIFYGNRAVVKGIIWVTKCICKKKIVLIGKISQFWY